MTYVLDTTTTDVYTELPCPGTISVTVQVSNNPVYIGFGQGGNGRPGAAIYGPGDEVLIPSTGGLDRACDAVRVKNYVKGQAANVKITAVPAGAQGG